MWFSEVVERTYAEYRRMTPSFVPIWDDLSEKEQELWCNVVRYILRNC